MAKKIAEKYLEQVQPKEGEDAKSYAERFLALSEQHERETGEGFSWYTMFEGQGASEYVTRSELLDEWKEFLDEKSREKSEKKARQKTQEEGRRGWSSQSINPELRVKAQERRAQAAVESFEAEKKKLYKGGGYVYSPEEHRVRLGAMSKKFCEKVDGILSEVEEDVQKNLKVARGLTYQDPTAGLTASERDRLTASAPLVAEDCKQLSWAELSERLEAVEAGEDKVAKILHSRGTAARSRDDDERIRNLTRNGQADTSSAADKQARRKAREVLTRLEEGLTDPKARKRREEAESAAGGSKQLATRMRRMRSEADGSDAQVRSAMEDRTRAAF